MKLKKALAAVFVLMMTAAGLYAQQAGQWTLGARVGMAFGFNETEDFFNYYRNRYPISDISMSKDKVKMNLNSVFYINRAFTGRFSLQVELNAMFNQGYDAEMSHPDDGAGDFSHRIMTYTSLDFPHLVRFSFLKNKPLSIGLMAGPHISLPLGRMQFWTEYRSQRNDKYGLSNKIDTFATFGFTAGLYGGCKIGPGRFMGDLRYIFDFNHVTMHQCGGWIGLTGGYEVRTFDIMKRRALLYTLGYEVSL